MPSSHLVCITINYENKKKHAFYFLILYIDIDHPLSIPFIELVLRIVLKYRKATWPSIDRGTSEILLLEKCICLHLIVELSSLHGRIRWKMAESICKRTIDPAVSRDMFSIQRSTRRGDCFLPQSVVEARLECVYLSAA